MARTMFRCLLAVAALSASPLSPTAIGAAGKQTFAGVITDDGCGKDHSHMQMGPTDGECAIACVDAHGVNYALFDGTTIFVLKDHPQLQKFAGQKVRLVGVLDEKTKTIAIESISRS